MCVKRALFISLVWLLLAIGLGAQAPSWLWVKQAGGSGYDYAYKVVSDNQGYIYVCGNFMGDATFGGFSLTSACASQDIFVAKLDPLGNWLWVAQAGGSMNDQGRDLALDSSGNIYLTGSFSGTANFGDYSLSNNGNPDVFVAKLNNQGSWLWAQQAGGSEWDESYGIAVDDQGNGYITGCYRAVASFGNNTMESVNYTYDVFVAKINSSGEWVWATEGGGTEYDIGYDIALGDPGYAYITGSFEGSANFGPNTINSYGANPDIFVCRITSNGSWIWAEHAGSTGYDNGIALTSDNDGNSYVTGFFSGTASFGAHSMSTAGANQTFVAKINNDAVWQWTQQPGGLSSGGANDIIRNADGEIYITGTFAGNAIFGSVELTGAGGTDVYAAKMDNSGNWLWGQKGGGTGEDVGWGIAVNSQGNSFLVGSFTNYSTFGSFSFNFFGFSDIFIAKLNPSGVPIDDPHVTPSPDIVLSASPNPFYSSTTIKLNSMNQQLGSTQSAILSVYDLRGRLVKSTSVDTSHLISDGYVWDGTDMQGRDCQGGIYFLRYTTAGSRVSSAKISLIR